MLLTMLDTNVVQVGTNSNKVSLNNFVRIYITINLTNDHVLCKPHVSLNVSTKKFWVAYPSVIKIIITSNKETETRLAIYQSPNKIVK